VLVGLSERLMARTVGESGRREDLVEQDAG
jgi:hypothetical protein